MYIERRMYTNRYVLAGTNELHNDSLENIFFSSSARSLTHTQYTTKCLRLQAIKMLLFIANVSVKRVLFLMLLSEIARCRENRLSVGLKVHTYRSIDFLANAPLSRTKSAFKTHLNFVSLCKSSLLIGGAFFSALHPPVLIFLSLLMHCCVCSTTREESVFTSIHTWEGEEKNFRKTNCWKKKKWYREKECIQTTTMKRRKKAKEKISLYPYTDDEYTNIFKKEICRWNKLLELSADHFSKKKKKRAGARKWNKKYENQSIRDTESDFTWRNAPSHDWLSRAVPARSLELTCGIQTATSCSLKCSHCIRHPTSWTQQKARKSSETRLEIE